MDWPQLPDYGYIPRWPRDGRGFIHPQDFKAATWCIPSERVFRRDAFDGTYYHCNYGDRRFRLRPCLWVPVASDGLDIGDLVETTGIGMARELFVARIHGMRFVSYEGCILYSLRRHDRVMPARYHGSELRLLTNKARIREQGIIHPIPIWNGQGERLSGVDL